MKNGRNKKIAFLDRDGVINRSAAQHEYITRVADFVFNPGIFTVLHKLQNDGFEFIVVTNQRGIARGLYTEDQLALIHDHMKIGLREQGIELLDIFYCPHGDGECTCRKPQDGMLQAAAVVYPIDRENSILIGDNESDIMAGTTFGLAQCYLVPTDAPEKFLADYAPHD